MSRRTAIAFQSGRSSALAMDASASETATASFRVRTVYLRNARALGTASRARAGFFGVFASQNDTAASAVPVRMQRFLALLLATSLVVAPVYATCGGGGGGGMGGAIP